MSLNQGRERAARLPKAEIQDVRHGVVGHDRAPPRPIDIRRHAITDRYVTRAAQPPAVQHIAGRHLGTRFSGFRNSSIPVYL